MEKPNVLFILADDLGWGDVGYHGSLIKTPNIDRLAQVGIELDQHYVCPVCTPTRVSLMSGCHPGRFGKHATLPTNQPVLPDGYWTIASMFRDAGYKTGLFGKWHLGCDPKFYPGQYGFDYSYGSLAGGIDPYTHRYKSGEFSNTWHRNGELLEEQGHATDLITDEAIHWIKDQKEPWFCYVPYTAVHVPVRAPESWLDRYAECTFDEDPERDRSYREYAAYTSHMDYSIGQLIETLKCMNVIDNTIVIFASDNGACGGGVNTDKDTALYPGKYPAMPRLGSNYPLRGKKTQMYEGGIRTPAAISWPEKLQPGKLKYPIHIADWMPTFAALLDCKKETDVQLDGRNFLPLLLGEVESLEERPIYWNLRHEYFALRCGEWKLIVDKRMNRENIELYNIEKDPLEEKNCAHMHSDIVDGLMKIIIEHHKLDDTLKRDDVE